MRTTSVALGAYYENFMVDVIETGRYNNASEVIRAGLRMLEENEKRLQELSAAIRVGEEVAAMRISIPKDILRS